MKEIKAKFRIVTPAFIGGADQQAASELRVPGIKGALRFWYRSMYANLGVQQVRKGEAELFGSSDSCFGQSKVGMQLDDVQIDNTRQPREFIADQLLPGCNYLGYGVVRTFNQPGELTRSMIQGGSFTLRCRLHPSLEDHQRESFLRALMLLGTFGGVGARSRKGFGSLTLTSLEADGNAFEIGQSITERVQTALAGLNLVEGEPEWTAWSKKARVLYLSHADLSPLELLNVIGIELVRYRSYGRNGMVLGQAAERNFRDDHDLMLQNIVNAHPRRICFGLPHNYFFSTNKRTRVVKPEKMDRRASPLFIHIHQPSDDFCACALLLFLPARFLPEREQVRVHMSDIPVAQPQDLWQPIHGFLDRLLQTPGATPLTCDGITAQEVSYYD